MQSSSEWRTGPTAWEEFVRRHPELGLKPGKWRFHNFLRLHKATLLDADAIRWAQRRFWVAHVERLCSTAFDCATGKVRVGPRSPSEAA